MLRNVNSCCYRIDLALLAHPLPFFHDVEGVRGNSGRRGPSLRPSPASYPLFFGLRGFYLHTRTHARTRKVNLETGNLISAVTGHTRTRTRAHTLTNDSSSLQGHGADIMENGSLFFTIITGIGRVSC